VISGRTLAAVTYPDGAVEFWQATDHGDRVTAELTRTEKLASQAEGCVFDDTEQRLFVGEEDHGVWSIDLADSASLPQEVDTVSAGKGLVEDVEGMSLYTMDDGSGYLVVSAQGADRLIFYERQPPHRVVGAIRIASSRDGIVDGVSHTDGLEASSAPLPQYPRGLLIVQDDANPHVEKDQNFKLVDWRDVESGLSLPSR
jgi:3-phytase